MAAVEANTDLWAALIRDHLPIVNIRSVKNALLKSPGQITRKRIYLIYGRPNARDPRSRTLFAKFPAGLAPISGGRFGCLSCSVALRRFDAQSAAQDRLWLGIFPFI